MIKKDLILKSVLEDLMLQEKYNLKDEKLPNSVNEGKQSNNSAVRTIANLISEVEKDNTITEKTLYQFVIKSLNSK